ncbi:MAG: CDP-alcohol phosphatidyltransferase family protein [Thermoleophilia bacterium]|nr:CDP-alcohol phosphatidyltransferase family protein [Thermoleophilia bacterium]
MDPLALRLLPALSRRSFVTPLRLTLAGAFLSAVSVAAFGGGHLLWGAVLFEAAFFFDCLDGKLARVRRTTSELGAFLDLLLDVVFRAAAFLALALHAFPGSRLVPVALASVVFLESWLRIYPTRTGGGRRPLTGAVGRLKARMARRRLVLLPSTVDLETLCLFLAPLTGRLDLVRIALVLAIVGYGGYAVLHVGRFLRPHLARSA